MKDISHPDLLKDMTPLYHVQPRPLPNGEVEWFDAETHFSISQNLRDADWQRFRLRLLNLFVGEKTSLFCRNHWADKPNPTVLWPWSDWREEREYKEVFIIKAHCITIPAVSSDFVWFYQCEDGENIFWARSWWLRFDEPIVRKGSSEWGIRRRRS